MDANDIGIAKLINFFLVDIDTKKFYIKLFLLSKLDNVSKHLSLSKHSIRPSYKAKAKSDSFSS